MSTEVEIQERIITAPKPKYRAPANVWLPLIDKRVVIQQKRGALIIGTLIGQRDGFFVLVDATLKGQKYQLAPRRILVDRTSVAHMHEECTVEILTSE